MSTEQIGRWAFLIGIVLAVLIGLVNFSYSALILMILGLIVGFLNVSTKEYVEFLVAIVALIVIGVAGFEALANVGSSLYGWAADVLNNVIAFVGAAGVVVALKAIVLTSKEE